MKKKHVIIDVDETDSVSLLGDDPYRCILRCERCGKGWQVPYDSDTMRVAPGYWHCINGCHDKELGLKARPLYTVEGAGE